MNLQQAETCHLEAAEMDGWLERMLIDKGVLGSNGLTANARIHTCHCGIPCLAGWDSNIAAGDGWAELQPINTQGEAEALLEGRTTYDLYTHLGNKRLYRRGPERITGSPAGSHPSEPTLVQHRCDGTVPTHWRDTRTTPETTPTIHHDEEPNY